MAGTVLVLGGSLDRLRPAAHLQVSRISGFQIRVSQRLKLGNADNTALVGDTRGESRDYGADGDRLDRKASSHVTFSSERREPRPLTVYEWSAAPGAGIHAVVAAMRAGRSNRNRQTRYPSSAASRAALRLCSRMTGAMSSVAISPSSTIRRPPTTVWRAPVGAQNTTAATGSLKPPA